MDDLRKPLFFIAIGVMLLGVLLETGSRFLTKGAKPSIEQMEKQLGQLEGDVVGEFKKAAPDSRSFSDETPPGIAILNLALLDSLLLYSVCMMGATFVLTDRVVGRLLGPVSLVVSLVALVCAFTGIFVTLGKTLLMIALFTSAPFGTIAYMAGWGFFDRNAAATLLNILLVLKLAFAGCLVLSHPWFLQNRRLILMILCSVLGNLIIGFLHNFVPVFLVSITDAIAGIIVLVLALMWGIRMLIGAIIGTVKAFL